MENTLYDFGMIGLGTMGRNLLLNMADHGFKAIGFDLDPAKGKIAGSLRQPRDHRKRSEFPGRNGQPLADPT